MSRRSILSVLLIALFMLFAGAGASVGQPSDGQIVVNGADTLTYTSLTGSSGLDSVAAGVSPRILAVAANSRRHIALNSLPGELALRAEQVVARILVVGGNSTRHFSLQPLGTALKDRLAQVQARPIFVAANSARSLGLGYPRELVNDQQPPVVQTVSANQTSTNAVELSWTTSELTTATVEVGTSPGAYTQQIVITEYARAHTVDLTGLAPDVTYYARIISSDVAGNSTTGQEFTFGLTSDPTEFDLYLPVIKG